MKTLQSFLLIVFCLLGGKSHAQTVYNFTIGEIYEKTKNGGPGVRLPDGTIVKAQFIATKMPEVTIATMGDDMFLTGNGSTAGSVVDWLGGNFNNNPPGPASATDGNTLPTYVGSTNAAMFTTIQANNAFGIENGFNKDFAGSVGVRLFFNKPTRFTNFLFLDIDGKQQSTSPSRANKEWATAFGYRNDNYVPMTLTTSGGSSNLGAQTFAVTSDHGWYKMIENKLGTAAANDFPANYGKVMAHVTTDAGSGDDDPDVLANQFVATTQNSTNATVTDFFVLFGIAGNVDDEGDNHARSGMSPVALTVEADFGDAPNSYKTLLGANGPSHGIDDRLYLGTGVVSENDGKPDNGADGESNSGQDGVSSFPSISRNVIKASYTITTAFKNTTGQVAHFVAWLDKNADGEFQQSEGEVFDADASVTNGNATFTWTNFTITEPKTYLRIRVTTEALDKTDFKGAFIDGEVEDYRIDVPIVPLPVTLTAFTAKAADKSITLNWKTANEKNFSHFSILKSTDAKEFSSIGVIDRSSTGKYDFIDYAPANGSNYYRLKMVDSDESFELSRVLSVNFEADKTFLIAENPTKGGTFNVSTNALNPAFEMFTVSGSRLDVTPTAAAEANSYTLKVKKPASGLHILKMTSNGKATTRKIIIP